MIDVATLTDGGQTPEQIAERLAAFIEGARRSLDVAVYDFALSPQVAAPVVEAFRRAAGRGVAMRLVYNVDHGKPIPVPPPPRTDPPLLESCGVSARAIPGIPDLMHHKYVVRDGESLWTGSTNWTDDSWSREENVIVTVQSAVVAKDFSRDFEDLWSGGEVAGSGSFDPQGDTSLRVQPWFSPGRGRRLAHRISSAIGRADLRVRIASPVLTSGPILGTLAEVATSGGVDLAGVVDATQMQEVHAQWRAEGRATWKIPAFRSVIAAAPFSGKRSTPYGPGTVHDYMHAKIVVADDVVFVGSYNLSHSGEENAENVLEIDDGATADRLAAFVDEIRGRYAAFTPEDFAADALPASPLPSPPRSGL